MDKRIYLDYTATTPLASEVYASMLECFNNTYGNASSLHSFGRDASEKLEASRAIIAKAINAKPSEVYFTSGGTEANNWAIMGIAHANKEKGKHIIVSAFEHHSIMEAASKLETQGFEVSYIPITKKGMVNYKELVKAIRPDTILISVMTVNNEVGTIQPIKAISKLAKSYGILFHTDCVQALGSVRLDVQDMDIDALSISAHKIYGPKGIGALYIKDGVRIEKFMYGGEQERNLRAGTSDVPSAVGFAKATELLITHFNDRSKTVLRLKKYFVNKLLEQIPTAAINGCLKDAVGNIVNVSFGNIDGEAIVMLLDLAGIAVSNGAACASGSVKNSHVIMAINPQNSKSAVRFSFSYLTTYAELDYTIQELKKAVENLRKVSPVKKSREVQ